MVIDILVLVVLFISSVIAFLRGFIREVLTIFGVVGGAAAGYFGGPYVAPFFRDWMGVVEGEPPARLFDIIPYSIIADVLSYGIVFVGVVIILSIVSHFLAESAKSIGLGAMDRTLGVVFGMVRGVVLLALLYLPVYMLVDAETKSRWFADSRSFVYLENITGGLAAYLPQQSIQNTETGGAQPDNPEDREQKPSSSEAFGGLREKLQQIDLLKGTVGGQGLTDEQVDMIKNELMKHDFGYNEDFRSQMDQLFEQKLQTEDGSQSSQEHP